MKDSLDRIGKHTAYWEAQLHPLDPEQEHLIRIKLGHLANEALEEAGQLTLWKEQ